MPVTKIKTAAQQERAQVLRNSSFILGVCFMEEVMLALQTRAKHEAAGLLGERGSVPPTVLGVKPGGDAFVLPLPAIKGADNRPVFDLAHRALIRSECIGYAFFASTWVTIHRRQVQNPFNPRPFLDPSRLEVVLTYLRLHDNARAIQYPVVTQDQSRVLGDPFGEHHTDHVTTGPVTELLNREYFLHSPDAKAVIDGALSRLKRGPGSGGRMN